MKKYSRKREAILNKIRSTDTHPSAEWVYEQLKPEFPDLSLATVYRNIAEFLEDGSIISVGTVSGHERYDGCVATHPHFVCDRCGAMIDVSRSFVPEILDRAVSESIDAQVSRHELYFHGLCANCKSIPD